MENNDTNHSVENSEKQQPQPAIVPATAGELQLITETSKQQSGTLYVVMDRHRTTILAQQGLNQVYAVKLRKAAEMVAKEVGGVVETLRDALNYVAASPCNFPKDSKYYNPDKAAAKMRLH